MHVAAKSAAYVLLTISLMLVVGCDSSGSSGPPDSVEGTWTGSHSVSVELDTTVDGDPVKATGEVNRSYELVIAGSGADLSVEITVKQQGEIVYETRGSTTIADTASFSAGATYGTPTLVVTGIPDRVRNFWNNPSSGRWEFEVENATATGAVDIEIQSWMDPSNYVYRVLLAEGRDTPLTLRKQ